MFRIVDRGGAVVAASAAVVCLATLSWVVAGGNAARGERHPGGYVVVGGADPSGSASADTTPPEGALASAPVDPAVSATGSSSDATAVAPAPYGPLRPGASATGRATAPAEPGRRSASVSASPSPSRSGKPSPSPSTNTEPVPSPTFGQMPIQPDTLTVSLPSDAPGDHQWCESVTVTYTNSGTTPTTSSDAVFTTRVVDPFGHSWGRYLDAVDVPSPIAPEDSVTKTYDLCLAPWRVPPGLRMVTTGVTLVA